MPNPVWPATIPQVVRVNWQQDMDTNVLRTTMSVGPAKMRKRSTAVIKRYSVSLVLDSDAKVTTFEDFFEDSCACGATPFTWTDPGTEAECTMRFVDRPQKQNIVPGIYEFQFTVERLP